jgi:hypothetical protein
MTLAGELEHVRLGDVSITPVATSRILALHRETHQRLATGASWIEMKRPPRKTAPNFRLRALEILAAHPNGCTEAVLAAENIPADVLIDLLQSGLAVARNERLEYEDGTIEVTRAGATPPTRVGRGGRRQCSVR